MADLCRVSADLKSDRHTLKQLQEAEISRLAEDFAKLEISKEPSTMQTEHKGNTTPQESKFELNLIISTMDRAQEGGRVCHQ